MLEPEVAGLLKRQRSSKGKGTEIGGRNKKIKREVGVTIYSGCYEPSILSVISIFTCKNLSVLGFILN